ncbi:MAG: tetratricopeptide repeat protein [Chitinophagales bacterium]
MKRTACIIATLAILALAFNSCKQCNKPNGNDTTKTDTSGVPGLADVTAQIQKDSTNPLLWYKRAQLYDANNDYKSAATDMFIALKLDSFNGAFYLYTADLFKKSGDAQRGISLMEKAISTDSANTKFYVKAAELAYIDTGISGNYELSLQYLNQAIAINPQNADIYFFKGTVYKEKGDTAKAISSFQTATELNPKYYNAFVQIGLLLQEKKDKNAEKYFDNAIKVSEKPEDALYAKADILKEQGVKLYDANRLAEATDRLNMAVDAYKRVVEINYRNTEAYMGAAFCYYQMDSVERAYEYYDKALKTAPTYAGAYFSKGLCAEDLGKTQEAIMLYENCLNIDPNFTRAKEHLRKLQSGAQ